MGRAPCCDKANVKKGPWSPEEDAKLKDYMNKFGTGGNWIALPQKAGLRRCGKSCRLRWLNYLRPNIKHGEFSDEEDRIICSLYANIGSRWSIIAAQLPGRTDNDIKNYWNTKLKKKLMGFVTNSSQKTRSLHHQQITSAFNYNQQSALVQASSPYTAFYETMIPSNASFFNTAASCTSGISATTSSTLFQIQENFVGPTTTSSDGSCTNQMSQARELEYENMDFHSYIYNDQKPIINGGFVEQQDPLEYSSLEEIKQLISSTNNSSNLFGDENKMEEKVMMYY